jgi:hypothetical protein
MHAMQEKKAEINHIATAFHQVLKLLPRAVAAKAAKAAAAR